MSGLIIVLVVALLSGATPALSQVQNLCLQEIDGVVSADNYANISTREACNLDETTSGITATNNSWGDLLASGVAPSVPNPPSGTGLGGTQTGAIETVNDQFTQGASSKISSPISTWVYKIAPGGPSKANLQQGDVATYTYTQNPAFFSSGPQPNDEIVNYLVTRASNNGDELHAVWIFTSPVSLTVPSCTSKCTFTGSHAQGDLFLLSGFTGGGGNVGIQVFQWQCSATNPPAVGTPCDTPTDSSGGLNPIAFGKCSTSGTNFECGEVNDHTISVPPALPNPSTGDSLAAGLFYNGAVDVGHLFTQTPCFSAVLFESIASPSCSTSSLGTNTCSSIGNAASKFFIFSNFNTCAINVNKECGTGKPTSSQTSITYPVAVLVSNADGSTLTPGTPTDSPAFDSGSLGCFFSTDSFSGTSCTANNDDCLACETAVFAGASGAPTAHSCTNLSLTSKGSAGSAICFGATITNPVSTCVGSGCTDTVTETATGPGGSSVPTKTATASCSFTPVAAGLNVTKNCAAGLMPTGTALEVQVDTGYLVCNEQPAILDNVSLTDTQVSSSSITKVNGGITCPSGFSGLCLAPEGQSGDCATFTGSYIPTSLPSDVTSSSTCPNGTFSDTATATGQCSSKVCNGSSTGCTVSGTTVTCTASNGASCPLCPLKPLVSSSPACEAEEVPSVGGVCPTGTKPDPQRPGCCE